MILFRNTYLKMANLHGIDLILVMRLKVGWLAWLPSSFLLLSPLLNLSFLLAFLLLLRCFQFLVVWGCVWPRALERKMREVVLLCIVLILQYSFSLFLVSLGWPKHIKSMCHYSLFHSPRTSSTYIYIYAYTYTYTYIYHMSNSFLLIALAEILLGKGGKNWFLFYLFCQVLKPTFQSSINAHLLLYFCWP